MAYFTKFYNRVHRVRVHASLLDLLLLRAEGSEGDLTVVLRRVVLRAMLRVPLWMWMVVLLLRVMVIWVAGPHA